MAKLSISKSVLFVLLLLSVHGIEAKECNEGLPWITTHCKGEVAEGNCWVACQQRHGFNVKASCKGAIALPTQFCWCTWPC
ncbi:unnamed protein product [Withania somnifera]